MLKRSDLDIPRTPDEMRELLKSYEDDRETYSDKDVHLKRGVIKDLLEEYYPLYTLVRNLSNTRTGRLTPESNEGADAIVELDTGRDFQIQITCADESYQRALSREILSRKGIVITSTEKVRNPKTKKIEERGRALRTRQAILEAQVEKIFSAIQKKCGNFHKGTDALLVATDIRVDDSNIKYSWEDDLRGRTNRLVNIPYNTLYVANGDQLIKLKG